jgi:hypothetical protein
MIPRHKAAKQGEKPMNKLVALSFVLGLSANGVQAVPLPSLQTPDRMIINVEGGCGPGLHRDRFGACRPNGGGPVVVVPGAVVVAPGAEPCGGMGRHRVCDPDGRCRMVCN